jgi:hypothetical protein
MVMERILTDTREMLLFYNHRLKPLDVNVMHIFERRINSVRPSNLPTFIGNYYNILKNIEIEIWFAIKSNTPEKGILIGFRDRIFLGKLNDLAVIDARQQLTQMFKEFMKGITYFNGDTLFEQNQPIYHRNVSCPRGGQPNQSCNNLATNPATNPEHVQRCYLERLVYDSIWTEIMQAPQDERHLRWLSDTRDAYLACFPNCDLDIQMDYNERALNNTNANELRLAAPTKLHITFYSNGKIAKQEIYLKSYDSVNNTYAYPVVCSKTEGNINYIMRTDFNSITSTWIQVGGR